MSWFSNLFSTWPKRLPEGYRKDINVEGITIMLCGKNHPILDAPGRFGCVLSSGPFMWFRGYRRKDGKLTIKPYWAVAGHELQHLLNHADKEVINPDLEM